MDRLEESVREALRSGPPPADVEEFLRRVHTGTRRRRRRRRLAGAGAVVAAAAVAAGVVLAAVPRQAPPRQYAASWLRPRALPSSAAGRIVSFTASSPSRWWVLSSAPCPASPEGCAVVSGSSMRHPVRVDAPVPASPGASTRDTVGQVRFAVDGTDGWLFGQALWATHDGGRSWHRVALPTGTTVRSLAAYGDRVYALVRRPDGRFGALSAATSSDDWVPLPLPRGLSGAGSRFAAARGVRAFAAHDRPMHQQVVVLSSDSGRSWVATRSPCGRADLPDLAATGTAMWALCPGDGTVYTYRGGLTWAQAGVASLGRGARIAPVTDTAALVYRGSRAVLVDEAGSQPVRVGLRPGELVRYAGFNDPGHGFLITSTGRLLGSTDGGRTWTPVR